MARECLTLRERPATPKEGDAFPASLRWREAVLLMEEGPHRTCALGMHLPYGQVVSGQYAVHQRRPQA